MPSDKRHRDIDVFISSTSIDLPEYRQVVKDAILDLGFFPSGMENWPVSGENPVDLCRRMVKDAEIYIGIYAHRYGWRPDGYDGKSITELEYDWAGEVTWDGQPIPRLCFIMRDDYPWPKDKMEVEAEADLKRFKDRVKASHAGFFTTPDNLKAQVTAALANILAKIRLQETIRWEAGATFDNYTLRKILGTGGNGQVWLADQRLPDGTARPIAIKALRAGISEKPVRAERFRREISTMARIDHSHIVRVYDYGERSGQLYVMMPYLSGGTLRSRMIGKPMDERAALRWLEQIGAALDYVHEKGGILHRDVKPENILLDEQGETLYLADFGLVFSADGDDRLTDDGKPAGTGRYMAPEQWRDKPLDHRVDLYALGILAYELLTGHLPFQHKNDLELGNAHCEDDLPPDPALPGEVLLILQRMTAKVADDRYPTARAFLGDLRNWRVDPANIAPRIRDYLHWVTDELYDGLRAQFVELAGDETQQRLLPQRPKAPIWEDEDDLFARATAAVTAEHVPADEQRGVAFVENVRERLLTLARAVLIGEPGSGKTWMLQRLQADYARAWLKAPEAGGLIPVLVRLNNYTGGPFTDFVKAALDTLAPYHDRLLREGRLIILCDALNEMPRGGGQMEQLVEYLKHAPHFIISCRVRDYRGEELNTLKPLEQVHLHDLELPAIRELVHKRLPDTLGASLWAQMGGTKALMEFWRKVQDAEAGKAFWEAKTNWWTIKGFYNAPRDWHTIHSGARLIPLARNPYMGDLLCRTYQESGGQLPGSRAALFGKFIDQMLGREAKAAARRGETFPAVDDVQAALVALARALQQAERTVIPEADALTVVNMPDAGAFIRAATDANILARQDDDGQQHSLKFSHQLLQEYFAAKILLEQMEADEAEGHLLEGRHQRALDLLGEAWWEAGVWRETIVILGEFLGDGAAGANRVTRWLAPASPEVALSAITRSGAGLTLDDVEAATREALVASAHAKTAEPDPIGRAAAYRVLGVFDMDERPGVGTRPAVSTGRAGQRTGQAQSLPDIEWCEVPAGPFLMGSDKAKDPRAQDDETPQREVDIPYPYWMAKYPVTNAQYAPFVAGDGYTNRAYWSDAGWEAKEKERWIQPRFWDDSRWNLANHPVVGVSWYEAVAYTAWLDALYQALGADADGVAGRFPTAGDGAVSAPLRVPTDYVIRLPTETEWEKAARGADGRIYPWGDTWDAARCNNRVGDTSIGQTSAVGIFSSGMHDGSSPCGAQDMAGNVWEWCLSRYKERDNIIESDSVRVLRGGAWNVDSADFFRAAFRNRYAPDTRYVNWGFRVARSLVL